MADAAGVVQAAPAESCPPPAGTSVAPSTAPSPAALQPPPQQLLACIGSQAIIGSLFRHWASVARREEGKRPKPQVLIDQVMGFLISSDWVIGEAQTLNVQVSNQEVRRAFDRTRRQQFPKRREFEAFLKSSGQTVADLLFRVRINLLTMRVQRQVLAGQHGAAAQENALAQFAKQFTTKWRAQTYCAPAYAVHGCGHVQNVL
jgi:foldase protein PrsA